jgi:hypothetical protein
VHSMLSSIHWKSYPSSRATVECSHSLIWQQHVKTAWYKHVISYIMVENTSDAFLLLTAVLVTSVTPHLTPMDSEWDFSNGFNYYPHFTSIPFPISSRLLSQLLIYNLLLLLLYPHIVTTASATELLSSINT